MTKSDAPVGPLPRPRWRRVLVCAGLLALVALPCCGLPTFLWNFGAINWRMNSVPFDKEKWKAATDSSDRYDMSWDLVHRGVLAGMSRAEVEATLGKPMGTDVYGKEPLPMFGSPDYGPGVVLWYYNLGGEKYESGLGPSGAVLAVAFRGGKVAGVRKVVH